ncbi:MAG: FTR1 family protein [Acidobacteria bacterium]|nr:FTR1 family protein [Acidobacteriota bacterium]
MQNLHARLVALLFILSSFAVPLFADESAVSARRAVHLLDYISQDYAGAVKDGQVLSADEYGEMQEFTRQAPAAANDVPELRANAEIQAGMKRLTELVTAKASQAEVAQQALAVKRAILAITHLPVAPQHWPDVDRGRALFQDACAACHGSTGRGDGRVAAQLDPPPANLRDDARMRGVAPFQAFNTIRLGVTGTGMPAFSSLSDADTWALAFYAVSLRYDDVQPPSAAAAPQLPLEAVASKTDEQLAQAMGGSVERAHASLAAIRLWRPEAGDSLSKAVRLLRDAEAAYQRGDVPTARIDALTAYLDGIEPVEARLRAIDLAYVQALEQRMAAVRGAIERGAPAADVAAAVRNAEAEIANARKALAAPKTSPSFIISMAAAIVLREAFEAILIVVAILSVLRSVGAGHAARWVHAGWIAALALGVVAWFASGALLASSGLQREMLEAITSILAVVVLLYMGFWLHRRTEIAKWRAFVADQVNAALGKGRLFGLAAISFFAVFREVLETVLFLIALSVDGGKEGRTYMLIGVISALTASIILAWLLVRFSARLPLRTMFTATAVLMMALSVILAGKGLHSLQEAGLAGVNPIAFPLRVDLFGIYPTLQTLGAQLLTIALAAVLWVRGRGQTKPA